MMPPPLIPLQRPPAVWAAFARASAWKDWVIVFQLALMAILVLAHLQLSKRPPDVVLVMADGKSTYLQRSVADDGLVRFLDEQKGQPTDLGVLHFAREFLTRVYAINSSTFAEAWPEALAMMDSALRGSVEKGAASQKLIEVNLAAQVRSTVRMEELLVVERLPNLIHLRARILKTQSALIDGSRPSTETLQVELVVRVVPRTPKRPDGLEVISWRAFR